MGASCSTRPEDDCVKNKESNESKRMRYDEELEKLKQEIVAIEPAIKTNVRFTVKNEQDAVKMLYCDLTDREKMRKNIIDLFGGQFGPHLGFIMNTATSMMACLTSSDELQDLFRWRERTKVERIGDKVYGIEAHYKIKVLKESKGNMFARSKDTVMLVAYKCMAHVMDYDREDFPDDQVHQKLTF